MRTVSHPTKNQHMSALSRVSNANSEHQGDEDVRADMSDALDRIAPESETLYRHE